MVVGGKLKLILISYGLKRNEGNADDGYRSIPVADLYFDCRGVDEHTYKGAGARGTSEEFLDHVSAKSGGVITSFHRLIEDAIPFIPARRSDKKDPWADPFVVCFLCAHGMHRSVASKILVGKRLAKAGWNVEVK